MEPWRIFRPVLADTHHFDDESDPESHQNERAGLDPNTNQGAADPQHYPRASLSICTVLLVHSISYGFTQ